MAQNHEIPIPPDILIRESRLYFSWIPASRHQKWSNPIPYPTKPIVDPLLSAEEKSLIWGLPIKANG